MLSSVAKLKSFSYYQDLKVVLFIYFFSRCILQYFCRFLRCFYVFFQNIVSHHWLTCSIKTLFWCLFTGFMLITPFTFCLFKHSVLHRFSLVVGIRVIFVAQGCGIVYIRFLCMLLKSRPFLPPACSYKSGVRSPLNKALGSAQPTYFWCI